MPPLPPWQRVIRGVLAHKERRFLGDDDLRAINVNVRDDLTDLSTALPPQTDEVIQRFLASDQRDDEMENFKVFAWYDRGNLHLRSGNVSGLLRDWMRELEKYPDEGTMFVREQYWLKPPARIATAPIKSEMTAIYTPNDPERLKISISLLICNRARNQSRLTGVELFSMFALAFRQHRKERESKVHRLRLLVIHSFWVRCLSINVSTEYLRSMENIEPRLFDSMEVDQSLWFNFLEPSGQRAILQFLFKDISFSDRPTAAPEHSRILQVFEANRSKTVKGNKHSKTFNKEETANKSRKRGRKDSNDDSQKKRRNFI